MEVAFAVGVLRPTGIIRVVRNITLELAQHSDFSVSVICTGRDKDYSDYIPKNIAVYDLDIDRYGGRKRYLHYVGALRKLFSQYTPDVLVVSGMEHILFYTAASWGMKKTKRIAWEHRNFSACPPFRLEWLGKRLALKKWDGVLCITKKDYEQYSAYQGSTCGLHQIYNMTNFSGEKSRYDEESTHIMSCGYLDPVKGYDMLLKVAEKVFQQISVWTWDIYGDGDLKDSLEQEIHIRGLEGKVRLMGYDPDVQSRYKEYAMFVLTSRSEGMGMVLIEAQKAGLPVVSFDIPCGPSDVISDGENGHLIPAFDTDRMAERIIELIEDSKKREQYSVHSEMYHAEFEKEVIIQKWREMLGLSS